MEFERVNLNDGNGLLDSAGLIDTLIVDCNQIPKLLMEGQYVVFCNKIVEMVHKLAKLKEGVQADKQSLTNEIAEMRRMNNELAEKAFGLPVEKEAEDAP